MIESLGNTLSIILKRPLVLAPAFIAAVIAVFLSDLASWPMLEMIYEFAIELKGIQLNFFEMIVVFFQLYASKLLFFSVLFLASLTLFVLLLFFYSKYAMHYLEKDAFSSSLKYMFSRIGRAFGLVVFGMLGSFLAVFILFAVILFFPAFLMLNIILFFFLSIIFAFVFFKLYIFSVPAIVHNDVSIREGISRSWNFTSKKLPETMISFVVVFFTVSVITQLGILLVENVQEGILTFIIAAVFNSLVFAFGSLFFAFYYFNNYSKAEKLRRRKRKSK